MSQRLKKKNRQHLFLTWMFCRAMCKELGLQGRLTALQLKKKWENMKLKYKVIKVNMYGPVL